MMNLPQFLKAIDETTAKMPKENLADFIHDMARTLPEKERDDFLARLSRTYENNINTKDYEKAQEKVFKQKLNSLKSQLESIENGDLSLDGCLNDEYDDWYDSEVDEFQYSDPEGVLDIIEEACRFVHQCIDSEEYEAAREISKILIGLDIMVDVNT